LSEDLGTPFFSAFHQFVEIHMLRAASDSIHLGDSGTVDRHREAAHDRLVKKEVSRCMSDSHDVQLSADFRHVEDPPTSSIEAAITAMMT